VRFKRETEFQDTEIGKIPKEWKVVKLKDIATKIKMGGTPKRTVKEYWNGEILFAKIEDITNSGKYLLSTSSTITRLGLENSNAWLVPMNSLLITIYGTLGMVIINKIEVATNQAIVGVIPKRELVDVEFLYYWYLYYQPNWIKFVKKSTQPNLTLEIVANSKLPLPSLAEQKVIAEILSTVDRAIEVVDAGVVRLEGLKKALMRELLTGRIRVREENGKPVFHRETEFQDTEIGKIPKEWKIYSIEEIFDLYKGTTPSTKEDKYWGGDIPFVTPTDITALNEMNKIYLSTTEKYLTEEGRRSKSLRLIPRGSLLFTSRATIGYLAVNNVEVAINQGIIALIPKIKDLDVIYYYYYLTSVRKKLEELAGGSTYKEISMNTFRKLMIPHPPLEEQRKIAEILSTVNRAIELYREERVRLDRLKRGLMDLLLTGKIRVVED